MKKNSKKKGFTLIELIVVIAILGILAAIAIPRLAGFTNQATTARQEATANIVYKAWQTFEAAHDSADPTAAQMADLVEGYDAALLGTVTQSADGYVTSLIYDGVTIP